MLEGNCSPSESRALVCVEPETAAPHTHRVPRSDAAFIAHLIAMVEQVPQTREKCRAEPQDADAVYQDAIRRFSA